MVRVTKILVCGASGAGKTSLIHLLKSPPDTVNDLQKHFPTYEDTYTIYIPADKNVVEKVRIYEIGGKNNTIARHFVNSADALILIYDVTDFESFVTAQKLKADFDSLKDKREVPVAIIGTKNDQPKNKNFDTLVPSVWAQREKAGYFETNAYDKTTFSQILSNLVLRIIPPSNALLAAVGSLPAFSLSLVGSTSTGTIKTATCVAYAAQNDVLFAGHSDGHITASNFAKRRQLSAWIAHPNSQVIGVTVVPWKAASCENCLISQGRDGKIRFWNADAVTNKSESVRYPLLEVECCQYTLCPCTVWSSGDEGHFLAYVGTDEGDPSVVNLEVIRSADNLIVASVDSSCIKNLGMCMALAGVCCNDKASCRLLGGFEGGSVALFVNGALVARVNPLIPSDVRPITCLAVSNVQMEEKARGVLIAVGKAAITQEMTGNKKPLLDFEMLRLTSEGPSAFHLERCSLKLAKDDPSLECRGISSLVWRQDDRLLVAGLWNGDMRCSAVTPHGRLRCLGNLRSPGAVVGGGSLMGDWCSVALETATASGQQDQSLSVRGCVFLPTSKWLVSTAPASAGGLGTLNVWDVYRDC